MSENKVDVKGVIRFFGGPTDLCQKSNALRADRYPHWRELNTKAVQKWTERGSIPISWVLNLTTLAAASNRSFSIDQYFIK